MTLDDAARVDARPEPVIEWVARHPGPWFALVWAPVLLIAPVVDSITQRDLTRAGFLIVIAAGFASTVWLPFAIGRVRRWRTEIVYVGLLSLCTLYLVVFRSDRDFLFPLLSIAAAVAVRRHWALSLVSALTISGAIAAGVEAGSLDTAVFLGFATFMAGVTTFLVQYLIGVVADLAEAQERLAESAVAEERLRFSRDVHDLLGHTLSVIVVKAEAIRRLLRADAGAAEEHARDIEAIGRKALSEVREAVTGYRSVRYRDELANARAALSAANVRLSVSSLPRGLDATVDSLLGWIVREGATNVLRHASAQNCTIAITSDDAVVRIEIADDGRPANASPLMIFGSGLLGLRERVEALGGRLSGTATDAGFRLTATVPLRRMAGAR